MDKKSTVRRLRGNDMGLDACGKVSRKKYHWGYSGLHQIRWLALLALGMPQEIKGNSTFCALSGGWKLQDGWYQDEERTILWYVQLSGKYFPNLMFHSDCEGTYTKTGRLDLNGKLMRGNSRSLLKELQMIKDSENLKNNHLKLGKAMEIFDMFYDLVKDEVENGKGHITFR